MYQNAQALVGHFRLLFVDAVLLLGPMFVSLLEELPQTLLGLVTVLFYVFPGLKRSFLIVSVFLDESVLPG
jgi:hypothetical protein